MGRGNPTLPPVRRRGWPVRGRTEGLHPPPVQAQRPHPHPAPGASTAPKSPPYLDNPKKGYRHYTKQPLVLKRRQVSGTGYRDFSGNGPRLVGCVGTSSVVPGFKGCWYRPDADGEPPLRQKAETPGFKGCWYRPDADGEPPPR